MKEKWLLKAVQWSASTSPDRELFPPPLVDRYYEVIHQQSNKLSKKKSISETQVQPVPEYDLNPKREESGAEQLGLPNPSVATKIKPWYKSKWVWLGASAVAAGFIVHNNSKSERRRPTRTSKEGF